eukprot:1454094-Rhodomonas_salina.3
MYEQIAQIRIFIRTRRARALDHPDTREAMKETANMSSMRTAESGKGSWRSSQPSHTHFSSTDRNRHLQEAADASTAEVSAHGHSLRKSLRVITLSCSFAHSLFLYALSRIPCRVFHPFDPLQMLRILVS